METFDATQPIYWQLAQRIRRQIVRGDLKPGEKLPSVREMAFESGVNPNTVQRTYSELERMEIVETRRGQGTFVTERTQILDQLRAQLKEEQIGRFVKDMEEMGYSSEEMIKGLRDYLADDRRKEMDDNDTI